jgi:hypothetical protein
MCVIINKAQVFLNELNAIVVLLIFLLNDNCVLNYLKFELFDNHLMFEFEIQIQIWFEFIQTT